MASMWGDLVQDVDTVAMSRDQQSIFDSFMQTLEPVETALARKGSVASAHVAVALSLRDCVGLLLGRKVVVRSPPLPKGDNLITMQRA